MAGGKDNLRRLTPEQAREIGRKGGSRSTPAKSYAQKLNKLRQKGFTDEATAWFLARIEDPNCNMIQIQKWIDDWMSSAKDFGDAQSAKSLVNSAIAAHKAHHGDKSHVVPTVQVNVQVNNDWREEKIKKLIEEEEKDGKLS